MFWGDGLIPTLREGSFGTDKIPEESPGLAGNRQR